MSSKLSRLKSISKRLGLDEVEDLTIHRQFINVDGSVDSSLEIIVARKGMTKEEISKANAEAKEISNAEAKEISSRS